MVIQMVLPRNLIALVPMKGIGCALRERLGSKDVPDEAWIPKLWHLGLHKYGSREWVALENSNLQRDFLCCPGRCCDCCTKVCVEIGYSGDQLAGGMVVVKGEMNQLVVHTAICIC